MATTDAKPVPQKNVAYRVIFPIFDADGDLVTGASWTSYQYSTDNGTAGNTSAPTESALTGIYYVDLTNTIMNGDSVMLKFVPSTAGAKPAIIILYPEEAGDIRVNITQCNGGTVANGAIPNVAAGSSGGLPTVDSSNAVKVQSGTGANQISLSSGTVTVGTNNDKTGYTASTVSDKTGYSLTQTFPTNFSSLAITVGGAVTAGTVSDKTGYSLTQGFPSNFSSLAITGGGAVTVGTNNDKTGYTASTVSDKTGYSISGTKQTLDALNDITAASVWAVGTRALTDKAGFSISGTKTTLDALNDITAASVWAVGTREITGGTVATVTNGVSIADTTSDAVIADAVWNALMATYGGTGSYGEKVESLSAGLSADDVWDEVVEGSYTARQYMRGFASALMMKSAGGGTSTLTFRDSADSKNRISATVDSDGNRDAVSLTLT